MPFGLMTPWKKHEQVLEPPLTKSGSKVPEVEPAHVIHLAWRQVFGIFGEGLSVLEPFLAVATAFQFPGGSKNFPANCRPG